MKSTGGGARAHAARSASARLIIKSLDITLEPSSMIITNKRRDMDDKPWPQRLRNVAVDAGSGKCFGED